MKKPHITGRFRPVVPNPLLNMSPAAATAPSTKIERIAIVIQNHLGECNIDLSRSALICFAGRTLPSCMEAPKIYW
jgi:hypothetical protein